MGGKMALIRFRIQINKGRRGVPLKKFTNIGRDFGKFLRMLGEDIGIQSTINDWIAVNFDEEHSVAYDQEYQKEQSVSVKNKYNRSFRVISDYSEKKHSALSQFRKTTLKQFCDISKNIERDESISFGLYTTKDDKPNEWKQLTLHKANVLSSTLDDIVECYGAIQGEIFSLIKSDGECYVSVKELSTGNNIQCYFNDNLYSDVVSLLKERRGIVHVYGNMKISKIYDKIESLIISEIKPAIKYQEGDLERFIGCVPNLTGELSTEQFISRIRDDS
jgi:hypothetical protein